MKTIIKKAALAAAIISAPLAASATDLVGGGASLPALAYVGDDFTTTNPQSRLSTDINLFAGFDSSFNPYEQAEVTDASIFGVFQIANPSHSASYCQTGSGTGKRVLVGSSSLNADGDCRDYSASPVGFSAPAGQTDPDFVGSDAPLTADDVTDFLNGPRANRQDLVQVPALGALIALPLNLGNDINGAPITRPNLSTSQVCDIFSGTATTWDQVNASWPSQPINVVYRSDDSGTVFAFTQYLAANCNGSQVIFNTDEVYPAAAPIGNYAVGTPASGNGGIITAVSSASWSIGFANLANVLEEQGLDYADVEGEDPAQTTQIQYDPNDAEDPFAPGDLYYGKVLGNVDPNTGLPQVQNVSGIDSSCVLVIDPAAQLTGAYPIAAVTNLLTYTDGNSDPQALKDLVDTVVNGSSTLPTGFAYLSTGATASSTAASCIN
jgi:phosphate transport system substrate-binding protein